MYLPVKETACIEQLLSQKLNLYHISFFGFGLNVPFQRDICPVLK